MLFLLFSPYPLPYIHIFEKYVITLNLTVSYAPPIGFVQDVISSVHVANDYYFHSVKHSMVRLLSMFLESIVYSTIYTTFSTFLAGYIIIVYIKLVCVYFCCGCSTEPCPPLQNVLYYCAGIPLSLFYGALCYRVWSWYKIRALLQHLRDPRFVYYGLKTERVLPLIPPRFRIIIYFNIIYWSLYLLYIHLFISV